jgi:acetyltransferase-like isoleucine patch superfamily enzyme
MLNKLKALQKKLQKEKMRKFQRRVSLGDLLTDRWENAKDYGFGEGTSCYDNVLVLGDVKVGKHVWIGPNTILDGSGGGLVIGDYCTLSAGVQIYTHNNLEATLTKGKAPISRKPTRIGERVYIGPNTIIQMGITIGDGAVVGAMSLVNRNIPAGRKAWGCPARIQGKVEAPGKAR